MVEQNDPPQQAIQVQAHTTVEDRTLPDGEQKMPPPEVTEEAIAALEGHITGRKLMMPVAWSIFEGSKLHGGHYETRRCCSCPCVS